MPRALGNAQLTPPPLKEPVLPQPSVSALSLRGLLSAGRARSVVTHFGRVYVWRLAIGEAEPTAAEIAELHKLTDGVVDRNGWGKK